ncbi:MAG: glyoxalase [Flavobacteriaceae bacterium]
MSDRDNGILLLRGGSLGDISNSSEEERFQNQTIRPILQLQTDLFVASFKNYIKKHKNEFLLLTVEKKLLYIENAIQKDIKYRNALKGMIMGWFTLEEFENYTQNSSNLNKRMMNLLIEILKNNVQLLDTDSNQ